MVLSGYSLALAVVVLRVETAVALEVVIEVVMVLLADTCKLLNFYQTHGVKPIVEAFDDLSVDQELLKQDGVDIAAVVFR